MRILIAEDEKDLNHILKAKLCDEGFSVDNVYDGDEAILCFDMSEYDVVVLDIMMPGKDGFEVFGHIRNSTRPAIPVIFLTARDAVDDRIKGLDSGANDYLIKPFSLDELVARIRAAARSIYGNVDNYLKADDLVMNLSSHTVTRGGLSIHLSAKEYQLLEYLLYNKGIVLSREKIENHIWNYDYEGGTNVVDVYIRYLRKKIDEGFDTKLIKTVRGEGYILNEKA